MEEVDSSMYRVIVLSFVLTQKKEPKKRSRLYGNMPKLSLAALNTTKLVPIDSSTPSARQTSGLRHRCVFNASLVRVPRRHVSIRPTFMIDRRLRRWKGAGSFSKADHDN